MRASGLAVVLALAGCVFDPEAHPDARVALAHDAPAPAPVAPLPEPGLCECTVVGPMESPEMTLPFSRNTTYVGGSSQVKSADLNALQDMGVANIGDTILSLGGNTSQDLNDVLPPLLATNQTRLAELNNGLLGAFVIRHWLQFHPGAAVAAGASNQSIAPGKFSGTATANAAVTVQQPSASAFRAPFAYAEMKLLNVAASPNAAGVFTNSDGGTQGQLVGLFDQVVAVHQVAVNMSAIGANGVDLAVGFHHIPSDFNRLTSDKWAMFVKRDTDTNWRAQAANAGGSTVDADTGVPPVANTWQQMRIEYHGVTTPVGVTNGSATARFFINDTQVAQLTGVHVPAGIVNGSGFGLTAHGKATATGPAGDFLFRASPMMVAWKPFLTP